MATGATGQLGLALPVQGELSGTWGDTVNNGITQYTNIAIAGTLTLTNDGAVTLANTTGDASASNITSTLTGAGTVTAQFAIVRVTGTLTVAKVVTGPSYSKTYTVVNAATGGIVTFKASGQTGVSVAVGESAFVYFNGTDYVKLVGTATAGAAGGSTTQVQYNNAGVLAGSANMTFNGTTLTVNDLTDSSLTAGRVTYAGTAGNLVDSANLTFNGTTLTANTLNLTNALGTAYGGTGLTSFTSGGVVYASSTSALATGSALTFDGTNFGVNNTNPSSLGRFVVTGSAGSTYVISTGNGLSFSRAGANYIRSSDAASTLISEAPTFAWYAQDGITERMRLISTGLGIGTTSPESALHVVSATNTTQLSISNTATSVVVNDIVGAIGFKVNDNNRGTQNTDFAFIRTLATQSHSATAAGTAITFGTTPDNSLVVAEGMRLTSTGLGIGTNSPTVALDVVGQIKTSASSFTSPNIQSSGVLRIGTTAAEDVRFGTNSTERMRLDSAGNLGLGVTPSAWISTNKAFQFGYGAVRAFTNSANTYLDNNNYVNTSGTDIYLNTGFAGRYRIADNQHIWYQAASGTAGTAITFTQAMTLTASGQLAIGLTSASTTLHVSGATTTDGSLKYNQSLQSTGAYNATPMSGTLVALKYNTAGDFAGMGGWSIGKENATDGNYSSYFAMHTRANGGDITERARIDSSGNLLVGTTDSNPNSGDGVKMNAGTGARTSIVGAADTNANFAITVYSRSPNAYRFQVGYGGTIYATSTSITAISDQTLKTNVRDLETGLTEVMALQPRRFDWINGDASNVAGFIAQEVQQILPDLVEDYQYSDEETKLGLKMGDILPTLVKAIQEQQAIIESLKARLDAANL
jgi:hypothetical protein